MPALRLVFAGSPAAAVPSLEALLASRHELAAVVTREPSPQGRRRVLTPTPVADSGRSAGVTVIETNRLAPVAERIAELEPDLGVIVAYGALVREPLLSTPRLGWINLHFSLLPRWRGAAPVQHALLAGDEVTGASVFRLVEELDAGDVFGQLTQRVGRLETAGHLLDSLAVSGAELLVRVVDALGDGTARAEPQRGDATLAPKLTLDDGRVRWDEPAERVLDRIRAMTPEPGAFTLLGDDRLKILAAAPAHDAPPLEPGRFALAAGRVLVGTGRGAVELDEVQAAGRRPMPARDWWRGLGDREVVAR